MLQRAQRPSGDRRLFNIHADLADLLSLAKEWRIFRAMAEDRCLHNSNPRPIRPSSRRVLRAKTSYAIDAPNIKGASRRGVPLCLFVRVPRELFVGPRCAAAQ
jgi:hypothetical protein